MVNEKVNLHISTMLWSYAVATQNAAMVTVAMNYMVMYVISGKR